MTAAEAKRGRSRRARALTSVALVVGLLGVLERSAFAAPVACQRAIAKAASAYAEKRTRALAKCSEQKLSGRLPPSQSCPAEPKTGAALLQAEMQLRATIAKACGGKNKTCAATDAGPDADETLAAIGWDLGSCPGFEGSGCRNAIADCVDVATCLVCVESSALDQGIALVFDDEAIGAPGSALGKCQVAVGKANAKLLGTIAKALGKCEDAVLKGGAPGPCPVPGDGKAEAEIAKAQAKAEDAICKACGGGDGDCGGGDDLTASAIGFPASCPAVGAPSCGGAVSALDEVVTCARCVLDFKTTCVDALSVPGLKPYPGECGPLPTPTPTPTISATPTATPTPSPTATPPPTADELDCQRAIVKESKKFAVGATKALQKCEEQKLVGALPAATECATEIGTAGRVAKADGRLRAGIAKACGGRNESCDVTDGGADMDLPLLSIGWQLGSCPDLRGAGCTVPLVDCADVAECLACIDGTAAVESLALYYGSLVPASAGSETKDCQLAIGKAATAFVAAKLAALAKCEDALLRGKAAGPCPVPGDGKAAAAISKAETKMVRAICQACGGGDGACGGGDDLAVGTIGFPSSCPPVVVPGGSACASAIDDLDDLVACVRCLSEANVDCVDFAAVPGLEAYPSECRGSEPTPTPTATPGGGGATCGNGIPEAGELCDDGNTANCDACPADCQAPPADCAGVQAARHDQQVRIQAPTELGAVQVCLSYPAGTVGLPGTGPVGGRLTGFAGSNNVVDFGNAAQIALLPAGAQSQFTFTLSFDRCNGAPVPLVTEFSCITKDASDPFGNDVIPPTIVECTPVAAP